MSTKRKARPKDNGDPPSLKEGQPTKAYSISAALDMVSWWKGKVSTLAGLMEFFCWIVTPILAHIHSLFFYAIYVLLFFPQVVYPHQLQLDQALRGCYLEKVESMTQLLHYHVKKAKAKMRRAWFECCHFWCPDPRCHACRTRGWRRRSSEEAAGWNEGIVLGIGIVEYLWDKDHQCKCRFED